MAGSESSGDVFDVKRIRRLIKLMEEHELSEISLKQAEQAIRLRRGPEGVAAAPLPAPVATPTPAPSTEAARSEPADANIALIKSPMVGTYYSAPNPEAPVYVKVGDAVGPDSIVCIVEAMKVFNEIPAEVSGKIVAILVENGDPVEYHQPLFKVDTSG